VVAPRVEFFILNYSKITAPNSMHVVILFVQHADTYNLVYKHHHKLFGIEVKWLDFYKILRAVFLIYFIMWLAVTKRTFNVTGNRCI
jgi:hypothetical protein